MNPSACQRTARTTCAVLDGRLARKWLRPQETHPIPLTFIDKGPLASREPHGFSTYEETLEGRCIKHMGPKTVARCSTTCKTRLAGNAASHPEKHRRRERGRTRVRRHRFLIPWQSSMFEWDGCRLLSFVHHSGHLHVSHRLRKTVRLGSRHCSAENFAGAISRHVRPLLPKVSSFSRELQPTMRG